ncbi:MAG TPA: hypothetical protein VMY05_00205 [Acidobacteriota bacterium]|nr:hypothetical protein [Acidobacteriota bacterium]
MLSGLELLKSRRAWFVPDVVIWGLPGLGQVQYLTQENVDSTTSVLFGAGEVGQAEQEISFSELTDHRGNQLPDSIGAARVFPRSKEGHLVFVVGQESNEKFKIARDPDAPTAVTADLLILEMGE